MKMTANVAPSLGDKKTQNPEFGARTPQTQKTRKNKRSCESQKISKVAHSLGENKHTFLLLASILIE